ncbi:MAG TPA: alpha/beta hydrolase-fold protein [Candidatus Acidoferrales bacterium]|nr:alpha/beta hydrolase-fold protein [Candidatus Acidoferrales bacterium]
MKNKMKDVVCLTIVFLFSFRPNVLPQGFDHFLNYVNSLPDSNRASVVDSFLLVTRLFPVIENDTVVHFIYCGSAGKVNVPGDMNGWQPKASPMTHVGGTNMWYLTQSYPRDARLEYKYIINDTNWILDPLNPHQAIEGLGPNSELRMPGYVSPPEIEYYSDIPHGSVVDTMWHSTNLSNSRKIVIYLPHGYGTSSDSFPAVYFQDGAEAISLEKAENVMDYLAFHKIIPPVIAVFVPFVNRAPEYAGKDVEAYMKFFVEELVPFVDSNYRTVRKPQGRAVIGASFGGNISLRLGSTYPDIFGNVGAQSSYVDSVNSLRFRSGSKLGLKIYLDLGTYDIPYLIPMVHDFVRVMEARGYDYEFHEYHEGHSWGSWRAHLGNELKFFHGIKTGMIENYLDSGRTCTLEQPGPFKPSGKVVFSLTKAQKVSVTLFNANGKEVRSLFSGSLSAGDHVIQFSKEELQRGVYFYRVQTEDGNFTKKLIIVK